MKKHHQPPQPDAGSRDPQSESRIFRGLLSEGYIVPETPDEVRAAEADAPQADIPLPSGLNDPHTVLRRIQARIAKREEKTVPFPLPQESGVDEELSRAARHGRKLSPRIKAKMKKNRRDEDRKPEADGTED
jgi:hypothetical protein